MRFYVTSPIPAEYGYVPSVLRQPEAVLGPGHGVDWPTGVVYVNGGYAYPETPPDDWTNDDTRNFKRLVDEIAAHGPSVVMIDHARFPGRRSPRAIAAMEGAFLRPLRRRVGEHALIVQYGIDPGDARLAPSVAPSQVVYNASLLAQFENGTWPVYDAWPVHNAAVRHGDAEIPTPTDEDPANPHDIQNVWLPAVGQWTNSSGWWKAGWFKRALEACVRRGVENVFLWFDPRSWASGHPKFTNAHYKRTIEAVCYHADWPMVPEEITPSDSAFQDMLRALSADPFDMARLLAILDEMGESDG
jgi:hypothetical protein